MSYAAPTGFLPVPNHRVVLNLERIRQFAGFLTQDVLVTAATADRLQQLILRRTGDRTT